MTCESCAENPRPKIGEARLRPNPFRNTQTIFASGMIETFTLSISHSFAWRILDENEVANKLRKAIPGHSEENDEQTERPFGEGIVLSVATRKTEAD